MAVDLAPDPAVAGLAARTAAFVQETVIPVEEHHHGVVPSDDVRSQLQKAARDAGVFAPHVSAGVRRPRAGHARPRRGVRGGRLLACWARSR